MKEKRIDIYSSQVGFFQLSLLGSAGSFFTEMVAETPRVTVISSTCLVSIFSSVMIGHLYSRARFLAKKSKNKIV